MTNTELLIVNYLRFSAYTQDTDSLKYQQDYILADRKYIKQISNENITVIQKKIALN